jgi:prepilin-type N-terminal cleavage/methylation domain-containing protein
MISAAKTNKRPQGFSLIEIVMVLALAAILMGGAVGLMVNASDEHAIRNTSGQIELLAKRARTIAMLKQTPYALEFRLGIVRLMPLAEAGQSDDEKTASGHRIGGERVLKQGEQTQQCVLPGGMELWVRRWNSADWLPTGRKTFHIWRFDPNGLSEPLSVRLVLKNSWQEDTYHPLTATICDTQNETR